ncbi:hypothetical protein [Haloplanus sp. C73]|uniref:hypothetical protein n=1 Tax=Haloplanus sp. C73 TaxID=3421641 RepID=UPI003EB6D699
MRRRAVLAAAGASMAGLAGCLGDTEYAITDVEVQSTAPFAFDVRIAEPDAVIEHPARLEFELRNDGERAFQFRNTGIWPFGLLELVGSPDPEDEGVGALLWTEEYESSEYVDIENRQSYGVESTPLVQSVASGETVSETYELHGEDILDSGTMYVRGKFEPPVFEYRRDGGEWQSFSPEIAVTIAAKGLL